MPTNETDVLEHLDLLHTEHENWKLICADLAKLGAVTADDLSSSPRGAPFNTPGKILLERIRRWGDSLVRLRQAVPATKGGAVDRDAWMVERSRQIQGRRKAGD